MKQSRPKTFGNLATGKTKKVNTGSGIFDSDTAEPKRNQMPKPSCGAKQADMGALNAAMAMPPKKNIGGGGMSASKVQNYALKHGEK